MNPKERAEKLIIKFKTPLDVIVPNTSIKKNAIKCVDEILKLPFENQSERNYWDEVKNEIKKL